MAITATPSFCFNITSRFTQQMTLHNNRCTRITNFSAVFQFLTYGIKKKSTAGVPRAPKSNNIHHSHCPRHCE